jgi:hypothetical protein
MNNNIGRHPRTNGCGSSTWIGLGLVVISGCWFIACQTSGGISNASPQSVTPPPPALLRPGDDPAFDWERPGRPQATDSGDWNYAIKPNFVSSRTLQQTTTWLSWALVSYGRVQSAAESTQISDVKFSGCSMQWDEKRFLGEGDYMNETIYTVNLGELDLSMGSVRAESASLLISTVGRDGVRKLEKLWEKDGSRMKLRAAERTSTERSPAEVTFTLRAKDDIPRRAGWALVHAATLCGSKASR